MASILILALVTAAILVSASLPSTTLADFEQHGIPKSLFL
jgi:hypothetical protein